LSSRVNRRARLVYYPEVEITHYGRSSTRQHIGYVSTNMAVGVVRYLRKCGYSRAALWLYKTAVTLDAPLHWVCKGVQDLWRRATGRSEKARKSLLVLHGLGHFLAKGLLPFWRA